MNAHYGMYVLGIIKVGMLNDEWVKKNECANKNECTLCNVCVGNNKGRNVEWWMNLSIEKWSLYNLTQLNITII